jgi:hypothetical protein
LNLAPDHIYAVVAHSAGTVNVTVTPEAAFDMQLVARRTCADENSPADGMCANEGGKGGAETLSILVQANETVYIAAEGAQNQRGGYTITFALP